MRLLLVAGALAAYDGQCLLGRAGYLPEEQRRNLTYAGYDGPVKGIWFEWSSGQIVAALSRVLSQEILGFRYIHAIRSWNTEQAVLAPSGCTDISGDVYCDDYDMMKPQAHVGLEGWGGALVAQDKVPEERRARELLPHAYVGTEAMFLSGNVESKAFDQDKLILEYYRGWNGTTFPTIHQHFATLADVLAFSSEINRIKDSRLADDREVENLDRNTGDTSPHCYFPETGELTHAKRNECEGTVWVAAACAADPMQCVPVVTCKGWGGAEIINWAVVWDWPIALVDVSWGDYATMPYNLDTAFYWWYPDHTLAGVPGTPLEVRMPVHNALEYDDGNYRTGMIKRTLTKYVWPLLHTANNGGGDLLVQLFNMLTLQTVEVDAMMEKMSGGQHPEDIACEWLRNNEATWRAWIPELNKCGPGEGWSEAAGDCVMCEAGTFSFQGPDKQVCMPCRAGTYCTDGATRESPCDPGHYCPEKSPLPIPCGQGTSRVAEGAENASQCVLCGAGSFAESVGTSVCTLCALGSSQSSEGNTQCTPCAEGFYAHGMGSTICTACPAGTTTRLIGARGSDECGCKPGSYTGPTGCVSCAAYLGEAGSGSLACAGFDEPPTQKMGFQLKLGGNQNEAPFVIGKLYRCTTHTACPGGAANTCGHGLDSTLPACGACKANHFSRKGGCEECKGSGGDVLGPILVSLCVIACPLVLGFCYLACNSPLTARTSTTLAAGLSVGSAVTAFQMMGTFEMFSINWPGFLPDLLAFFRLFMFDFDIIRWECALSPGMLLKYFVRAILPAMIVLSYVLLYILSMAVGKPLMLSKVINSTGSLLQVLFLSIAMNSFVPFQCYSHMIPSSESSMLKFPAVLCGEGEHSAMQAMGIVAVLFVVAMLGSVIYLTLSAPHMTAVDSKFLAKYKFLFFRFRSDRYYFNAIFLIRNFTIGLTPALATNDASIQTIILMCVTGIALCLQMHQWPWREWVLNFLDATVLSTMVLISGCAMAILTPSFFQKQSVNIMVQAFAVCQVVALVVVISSCVFQLVVYQSKIVITDKHTRFTSALCTELRELARDKIVAIPQADQEATYAMLPDYDVQNLRNAIGLLNKVYGREDSSATGTKRIALGVRTIIQSIHKTSLEGHKCDN